MLSKSMYSGGGQYLSNTIDIANTTSNTMKKSNKIKKITYILSLFLEPIFSRTN